MDTNLLWIENLGCKIAKLYMEATACPIKVQHECEYLGAFNVAK